MTINPVAQHTLTTRPSNSHFMAYQKIQYLIAVSDCLIDLKLQMPSPNAYIILNQDSSVSIVISLKDERQGNREIHSQQRQRFFLISTASTSAPA